MHRILLLDTNVSSLPIYNFLIKENNEVFVIGGNPSDFLAKYAKNYVNLDYSKIDQTRALIDSLKIDFIVPGCNDLSYQICSDLNSNGKFKGLDNHEVTETINNKEKFRDFSFKLGLPVPKVFSNAGVNYLWPLIVKPVDAYSGRGTTILHEYEKRNLKAAIQHAKNFSRSKTHIIEEYVEGQLFSHSAFISDGKIILDFIVEEHSTVNPFVVDTSMVVFDFSPGFLTRIRKAISLMIKEMDLIDGLIHTQFIKNAESFWIIEVTRRCPGDLYSILIELSTGVPYAEYYAKPFLNQHINLNIASTTQSHIMRHTISQPLERLFTSLKFNLPVQIVKLVNISLAGDRVKASPFGRIALLFVKANSASELAYVYEQTLRRKLYDIL